MTIKIGSLARAFGRVRTTCDTYPATMLRRGGMHLNNDPLRSSILMSDVLRSASSLHVCIALAGAMMTGGVLDLIFWVFDPFGWKNEG